MSSAIISQITGVFEVKAKPKELFLETWLSGLFVVTIIVQFALLIYLVVDDVACIPKEIDIVTLINITTGPPQPSNDQYLAVLCGTQIRWDDIGIFIEKIVFLFILAFVFFVNKSHLVSINRYHSILQRERLPEFIGPKPVKLEGDYKRKMRFILVRFFLVKLVFFVVMLAAIVTALVLQHTVDGVGDILHPVDKTCGKHMKWVDNLKGKFTCHLEQELTIYILSLVTNVLAVAILLLFFLSMIAVAVYIFTHKNSIIRPDQVDRELSDHVKND